MSYAAADFRIASQLYKPICSSCIDFKMLGHFALTAAQYLLHIEHARAEQKNVFSLLNSEWPVANIQTLLNIHLYSGGRVSYFTSISLTQYCPVCLCMGQSGQCEIES